MDGDLSRDVWIEVLKYVLPDSLDAHLRKWWPCLRLVSRGFAHRVTPRGRCNATPYPLFVAIHPKKKRMLVRIQKSLRFIVKLEGDDAMLVIVHSHPHPEEPDRFFEQRRWSEEGGH